MTDIDLYDDVIDWDTVDRIFFDVGAAAKLVSAQVKRGAARFAEPGAVDLAAARDALFAGAAGVQLRYLHGGVEWWDTLIPTGDGRVRIVRARPPDL